MTSGQSVQGPLCTPLFLLFPHHLTLAARSALLTAAAGATWAHTRSRLVVRFVSATSGGANVAVCRKASPAKETLASCKAGLDNDCNGKTGWADAVCKPLLTAAGLAPSPPPRPPPPRPSPRPPPPIRRPPPPVRTGRLLRQVQ